MFNIGDKVARRSTPNVLLGVIDSIRPSHGYGEIASVNGTGFWINTGRCNAGYTRPDDIVPYQPTTPPVPPPPRFWVVWREYGGNPTVKHQTKHEAVNEAVRLAAQNLNSKFYVLEAVEYHQQEAAPIISVTLA